MGDALLGARIRGGVQPDPQHQQCPAGERQEHRLGPDLVPGAALHLLGGDQRGGLVPRDQALAAVVRHRRIRHACLPSDDKTGLRSVINSGHTRGQGVVRCVGRDEKTPELFPTFCPKAIGMCGRKMPETTLSRCIFVELRRKKATEGVTRFTHQDDAELADLRRRLARWAADSEDALRTAAPKMPAEFSNRRGDNWRVLFAIADLAGEEWGDKARDAAVAIERTSNSKTAGVRVLAAIKVCFDQTMADAIGSQDLVDMLAADTTSEWAEWRGGKPITQRQLAILLKPLRIFPDRVRIGAQQVRGYQRSWFEDTSERYLPVSPRIYPSMRQKANSHAGFFGHLRSVSTLSRSVTGAKAQRGLRSAACHGL